MFENYGGIGEWRTMDGAFPIDAAAEVPGIDIAGEYENATELMPSLRARFLRCNPDRFGPSCRRMLASRRNIALGPLLMLAALACGGGDDPEPGTELAACVQGQFCESPLQCVDEICVHPDQVGGDEGSQPGDGDGDGSPGNDDADPLPGDGDGTPGDDGSPSTTGPGGTDGGGAEIYCGQDGNEFCLCGHTADYGPLGASCGEGTVASPALCCANEGWPAYGGCSCWTVECRQLSPATCYCGIGFAEPEEAVGSCSTPDEGGGCCLDTDGGSCTCSTAYLPGTCPEGESSVGSCSTASLGCGTDSTVSACN